MTTWEYLLKQMLWKQLGDVRGLRILDFGSGEGDTAAHLAAHNDVTAVEPSEDMLSRRAEGAYTQLCGGIGLVEAMPASSFDLVICHNVLEYVDDKAAYLAALARVVKPGGRISLAKHNRPGRVMQMTVLLNDFAMADNLLSGGDGTTSQFGAIRYYEDGDALRWLPGFVCEQTWGARTFWDLQQKQECHTDPAWQARMLAMEERVSQLPEYQAVAFFHHLLLRKTGVTVRQLRESDAAYFAREEQAQGWHTQEDKFLARLADQQAGKAICLVAEDDGEPAGYVNVYPDAQDGAFGGRGWPEIVDFAVLERFRRRGIGTALMDAAEQVAARHADTVYLGVGLHSGYGAAQRMYVRRGYEPDGSGAWYAGRVWGQYENCCNDDDLVLYLSKKLR